MSKPRQRAALQKDLRSIDQLDEVPAVWALAPALDVKLEILRQNPHLASKAESALARGRTHSLSSSEFHAIFNYLFVVGDHEGLAEVALQSSDYGHTIEHLDFVYLLPAYLYERLGLRELARLNYARYFSILRRLSLQHDLTAPPYQRRLTVSRFKLAFLPRVLPGVRSQYYQASYFSALISDFFEKSLHKRAFLEKYVAAGLIERPVLDETEIAFDPSALRSEAGSFDATDEPFIQYELCASELGVPDEDVGNHQDPWCADERFAANLQSDAFLGPIAYYLQGRLLQFIDPERARASYARAIAQAGGPTEFLKDDALFGTALSYLAEGNHEASATTLRVLVTNFPRTTYDFIPAAQDLLTRLDEGSFE